jgi:hypothetical protein
MIAPPKPPPQDELEALIKEARARQLRRRLLGVAGVAIAAAIGLSAYALTIGGGPSRITGSTSVGGAVPPCRSSQLSASGNWIGAAGSVINDMPIVNRGGNPCSLPMGRPGVQVTWRGSLLPIKVQAAGPGESYPGRPVHVLAPGRMAVVYLDWGNWCARPYAGATTNITLRFDDGLRMTARHVFGQPPCMNRAFPSGITVSRLLTAS